MAMMIADGSKTGRADPAFPAHVDVVHNWSLAIRNQWLPAASLQQCVDFAGGRVNAAKQPWSVATGHAAALLLTLQRVGWQVVNATTLITDDGRTLDLNLDPPIVVSRCMVRAVRRWRWRNMSKAHPSLNNATCSFEPIPSRRKGTMQAGTRSFAEPCGPWWPIGSTLRPGVTKPNGAGTPSAFSASNRP